nr:zinc finger BED domain-containing protein RICESLEEPER 1-like [Spinacia oleracea]
MEFSSSGEMHDSSATSHAPPNVNLVSPNDDLEYQASTMREDQLPLELENPLKRSSNVDVDVAAHSDGTKKKGRKKCYVQWDNYEVKIVNGEEKAQYLYCKTLIGCATSQGTSAMKNHILRCKSYPPNIDHEKKLLALGQQTQTTLDGNLVEQRMGKFDLWKFNQEDTRKALAKMVIIDEMPFRMVEHEGFRSFMKVIQPFFIIPSRWTVTRDCFQIYMEEKKKLKSYFSTCTSRISLTTDTWTSCQNLNYMCLTSHFIDINWKLHKKILNFCIIPGHSGETIGKSVQKCLLEWGISRVMTITVDNASSNDVGIQYLIKRFESWKTLVLDDTRWNSTYLMLEVVVVYQRAFELLECSDGGKFKNDLDKQYGVPQIGDWVHVASFIPFLKMFYDATLRVSGSLYITSNTYLQELVGISVMIKKKMLCDDIEVRLMAVAMKKKHAKYWENLDDVNLLLYVAVILDPMRKMEYTKWEINQIYDVDKAECLRAKVTQTLYKFFDLYASELPQNEHIIPQTCDKPEEMEGDDSNIDVVGLEFEKDVGLSVGVEGKSELTKYLEDDREVTPAGKSFDCLGWWKKHGEGTLCYLSWLEMYLPFPCQASESAFSTGGRVLDQFRSSFSTKMVEALICTQDWLRTSHGPLIIEESLEEMERIEACVSFYTLLVGGAEKVFDVGLLVMIKLMSMCFFCKIFKEQVSDA